MSNFKGDKSNVIFSNINQPQILTNVKLAVSNYTIDDNGDIVQNFPIINAIDIDWNNFVATEIETPIKTTADLVDLISTSKVDIKQNSEYIADVKDRLSTVETTVQSLGENILNSELIQSIQSDIENISNALDSFENKDENFTSKIETISENIETLNASINVINETINSLNIPRFVRDLADGYDVLRISAFDTIKNQLQGESAFDIAKRLAEENNQTFNYANEAEWLASFKGDTGASGASAYEIAKRTALLNGETWNYANEEEWITAIQSGADAKDYTDQQIQLISSQFNNLQTSINNILNDAPETYDTFKEISEWIENHGSSINELTNVYQNKFNSILGEVTEEVEDPDTHELFTRIKQFSNNSGSLNGQNWATSIQEINELLNNVSFASNVQDNAEANKINEIDFAEQDVSQLTGDDTDLFIKFGLANLDNKNVGIEVNLDLLNKIQQHTLNLASNDAQSKATEALEEAKEYTDRKISWKVM